eukprot:g2188.t1
MTLFYYQCILLTLNIVVAIQVVEQRIAEEYDEGIVGLFTGVDRSPSLIVYKLDSLLKEYLATKIRLYDINNHGVEEIKSEVERDLLYLGKHEDTEERFRALQVFANLIDDIENNSHEHNWKAALEALMMKHEAISFRLKKKKDMYRNSRSKSTSSSVDHEGQQLQHLDNDLKSSELGRRILISLTHMVETFNPEVLLETPEETPKYLMIFPALHRLGLEYVNVKFELQKMMVMIDRTVNTIRGSTNIHNDIKKCAGLVIRLLNEAENSKQNFSTITDFLRKRLEEQQKEQHTNIERRVIKYLVDRSTLSSRTFNNNGLIKVTVDNANDDSATRRQSQNDEDVKSTKSNDEERDGRLQKENTPSINNDVPTRNIEEVTSPVFHSSEPKISRSGTKLSSVSSSQHNRKRNFPKEWRLYATQVFYDLKPFYGWAAVLCGSLLIVRLVGEQLTSMRKVSDHKAFVKKVQSSIYKKRKTAK